MHRRIVIVSAAIALVIGVTAIAAAVNMDAPIKHPVKLSFHSKNTASNFLNLDQSGSGLGNEIVSQNLLLQDKKRVGHLNAICTLFTKQAICQAVVRLDAGQVVLHGQIPVAFFMGGPPSQPAKLAITGGTGAYQHGHGYAEVRPKASGRGSPIFVLHITP